jgi:hypothetical protein
MSLYVAIRTAFVDLDGEIVHLREGAIAREGHRILEVAREFFKPLVVKFDAEVEEVKEEVKKVSSPKKTTEPKPTPIPEPPAPLPPVPSEGE